MKYIYIYIPNNSGSSIMKTNIFKLLDNVNIINKLILDKDSIYYILKKITPDIINILKKLKSMNNYLIYEPLDINWTEQNFELYLNKIKDKLNLFNHIVCNNLYISNKYKEICPNLKYSVIYHEYDMRFNDSNYKNSNNLYYVGSLGKSSLNEKLCKDYNINIINPDGSKKFINENYTGIHIDYIKNDMTYYYLHTATKLSTAMCFNSIFICNRVPVYLELLGEEYEFYINDDLSNLNDIISKAKDTINNNINYMTYLEKVKLVRKKLWYKYVVNDYMNLFTK